MVDHCEDLPASPVRQTGTGSLAHKGGLTGNRVQVRSHLIGAGTRPAPTCKDDLLFRAADYTLDEPVYAAHFIRSQDIARGNNHGPVLIHDRTFKDNQRTGIDFC